MDTETQNTDDTEKCTQLRCLDYMAEYRHCICKWKLSKSDAHVCAFLFYFIYFDSCVPPISSILYPRKVCHLQGAKGAHQKLH